MNETPPPPAAPENSNGLVVACATIIILAALFAGGDLLWLQLQRMENRRPMAPPEVTQALTDLRGQLERERADSTAQLETLQSQIAQMKEQQAAKTGPDLAPVQAKLDAIQAQLQEAPLAPAPVAQPAGPNQPLRDYLTLRRVVESGKPYAAELAVLIPELPATDQAAIATLQSHVEQGLAASETPAQPAPLKPWMESVNARLKGLVAITPSAVAPTESAAHAETIAALDAIEAGLLGR